MKWEFMGKRIETLRRKHNLSRSQFGEMIDISEQHLRLVEKGTRGLSVDSIIKICTIMDVSADYLLFGGIDITQDPDAVVLNELSDEQIEIALEIVKKVAEFVNSKNGNEALIRELLRRHNSDII